ncbi:CAMK family protein kinase [Histomonas meleagridis]|uniref:CAMK family protein kinase n=1 Tax=Histomonas meleagridis TaxID=135588 RepID=UPI00355AC2A1|nr:CAMK family protein kinase [Histomonas meleagridis]KAH0796932.1 CAMK family protein kinase [Histomonas meleagridis]
MEYCPNGNILDVMDKYENKQIPIDQVRHYIYDLVQAVRYLHSKIIVHRDIKPSNMLLDKDNNIKLCDFGLATTINSLKLEGNTICGTLNYISPEIYNQKGVTLVSDLWSIGGVLFTLVTGHPPFASASRDETLKLAKNGSFELPPDVDPKAADLICRLLNKKMNERPTIADILSHPFITNSTIIEPKKCPFNGGVVEIQADGTIVLDLFEHPTLFKILSNGKQIQISTKKGNLTKTYEINQIPQKYKERYEFTLKIVNQAERHKPLVIWNANSGKYVLFGNKSLGLIRGKKVMIIPEGHKTEIRTAMLTIVEAVMATGQPKWPVVVGLKNDG